jgi:hypothetical protein
MTGGSGAGSLAELLSIADATPTPITNVRMAVVVLKNMRFILVSLFL